MIGLIVLFCTALGSFASPIPAQPRDNGLVYCPLQMQWVERAEKKRLEQPASLEVCVAPKYKPLFLEKIVSAPVVRLGARTDINELFLSFLTKGNKAFSEIPFGPGLPNKPVQIVEIAQSGAVSGSHTFDAITQQIFSFEQLSRPPSSSFTTGYLSHPLIDLRSAARAITSRGPPISDRNNRQV